jgi:hypothetical protein
MFGSTMIKIQFIVKFNFIVHLPASIMRVLKLEAAISPRISVTTVQLVWMASYPRQFESSWLEYVFLAICSKNHC